MQEISDVRELLRFYSSIKVNIDDIFVYWYLINAIEIFGVAQIYMWTPDEAITTVICSDDEIQKRWPDTRIAAFKMMERGTDLLYDGLYGILTKRMITKEDYSK